MTTKNYIVREGFNLRIIDARGAEKLYSAGDQVSLDDALASTMHQVELSDPKEREAQAKAEAAAAAAAAKAAAQAQAGMMAQAFANLQAAISPAVSA
jgi:hypothetical protein